MPEIINAPRNPLASSFVAPHELQGKSPEDRKGIIAERKLDAKVARMEQNPLSTLEKRAGNVDLGTILKRVYVDKNTGKLELSGNAFSHFLRKLTLHTTNSDALKLAAIKEYGKAAQDKMASGEFELAGRDDGSMPTLKDANELLKLLSGSPDTADFDEDAERQAEQWQRFLRPDTESVASEASLEALPEASAAADEPQPAPETMARQPGQAEKAPLEQRAAQGEANYDFKGPHRSSFAE